MNNLLYLKLVQLLTSKRKIGGNLMKSVIVFFIHYLMLTTTVNKKTVLSHINNLIDFNGDTVKTYVVKASNKGG